MSSGIVICIPVVDILQELAVAVHIGPGDERRVERGEEGVAVAAQEGIECDHARLRFLVQRLGHEGLHLAALDKVERLVGIVGADDDHIVPAERPLGRGPAGAGCAGRRVRAEQVRRFFHIVHDELLVLFHMLGKAQVGVDDNMRQT